MTTNLSNALSGLRIEQKRLSEQVEQLDRAITALSNLNGTSTRSGTSRLRRRMSAAARMRIAAAQRARWAKWKASRKKRAA